MLVTSSLQSGDAIKSKDRNWLILCLKWRSFLRPASRYEWSWEETLSPPHNWPWCPTAAVHLSNQWWAALSSSAPCPRQKSHVPCGVWWQGDVWPSRHHPETVPLFCLEAQIDGTSLSLNSYGGFIVGISLYGNFEGIEHFEEVSNVIAFQEILRVCFAKGQTGKVEAPVEERLVTGESDCDGKHWDGSVVSWFLVGSRKKLLACREEVEDLCCWIVSMWTTAKKTEGEILYSSTTVAARIFSCWIDDDVSYLMSVFDAIYWGDTGKGCWWRLCW